MNSRRLIVHLLILLFQMMLFNYLDFSSYIIFAILPVLIYNLPTTTSTLNCMLIAFFSGLVVDFFCDGVIGLNALALTPVAYMKKFLSNLFLGKELSSRRMSLSIKVVGFWKVFVCLFSFTTIYLAIYIWVDGASTRSLMFNLFRFAISLPFSLILAVPLTSFSNIDVVRR